MPVKLFTDSRPLLESIGSTKQVDERLMRNVITDLKEKLMDGQVESYSWLNTKNMVADIMTKEGVDNNAISQILIENIFIHSSSSDNLVSYCEGAIKIENKTS